MATYYADAVNGNDANDGSSWALAKATIPAVLALQSSGVHTLWLRNTFTISANVTVNSAYWAIRGESPAAAGITLTAAWQATGTTSLRHFFQNLTITPQLSNAFPQSPAMFSDCIINGTTYNWNYAYRNLLLIDCVITSTSTSYGLSNPYIRAFGCRFVNVAIYTANGPSHHFNDCCFRSCWLDLYNEVLINHCSFWKSGIFDRNYQYTVYRNSVFAYNSGSNTVPDYQFAFNCWYMSGNVAWNTSTDATTPAYLEYNAATVLGSNPFTDPDNDNFTPTSALMAVVGENGRTPGAKQGSSGGAAAGFSLSRLINLGG